MHPPPPPSPTTPPRRFKLHLFLSSILLSLLILYTTLRTPPTQSRCGTFHRDTTPLSSKLHLHRAHHDAPANSTTNDLGVEDLYQYALASPRFRNDKDARRLRRYLRSRPSVVDQGKGRRFGRLWGKEHAARASAIR